jgi:hypothetical protein
LKNIFLIKDNRKIFAPGIQKKAKTVTKMKETSEMDGTFFLNIFLKFAVLVPGASKTWESKIDEWLQAWLTFCF